MTRILLVANDPNSAQDIQTRLQRMGYDIAALTVTADQVIARADEVRPDIIMMDVRLQGGTEWVEAAQQIKSLHDIPIIFITANADEATVRRVIAAEPDGFFIKPLDTLELRAAIEIAIYKRKIEIKARESDRRIRELTDALPVVVYETDATGRMTFVNATVFDLFGYTKEEIEAGMTIFQLIAPADLKRARAVFRRRMRGEDVGRVGYTGLRKDGSTYPISIRSALMKRDGAVIGQRGVILDFTELKLAEDEIKEHSHTIEILNRIVTEGNRATEVQSFAEAATNLTVELMHFDSGTIHLFDDGGRRAKLQYATGIPDTAVEAMRDISLDDAQYAAFLVEPSPLFVDDREALSLPHLAELGLKSLAVVQLYRYDRHIGALLVGSFKRYTFSQAEKALLVAIGNEVGTVIAKLQTDDALKESERRIRELTDALPEVVYETDATGAFSFVSASCLEMFGYTKEEFEAGLTVFDVIVSDDRDRGQTTFRQRMDATELGWVEYTGLRKDGSTIPLSVSARPISHNGVVIGTRGIAADSTQRKRSEERLRESERRIREITDALPVVVYETDGTGRITFGNATAFDRFGYTKEELEAGMSLFQLIAPADRKRARAVFRRSMAGEDVGRVEYTGLRKDGSTLYVSIRAALMRQDGAVVGLRGIIVDITERKKAELALHRVQEELRQHATMFDAAHDAIVTLDPEGTIMYWNRGAERLYGWTKHEAEGQNANALLRTRFPESREALWPKLMENGLWEGELIHVTRDAVPVTVTSSWTLMTDEKGNPSAILEISSDITERKKAESALHRVQEELRQHATMFDAAHDAIVTLDPEGTITYWNRGAERLYGWTKHEAEGQNANALLRTRFPESREALWPKLM
ncbi:MAG: PAS domain S-box protein, partial [Halobacteriota archaeon]